MRPTVRMLATIAVLTLLICCFASVASACPTCKDGLDGDQSNVKEGYFWSIIFMMSMPFLIFASLGSYFFWLRYKARRSLPPSAANHVARPDESPSPAYQDSVEEFDEQTVGV